MLYPLTINRLSLKKLLPIFLYVLMVFPLSAQHIGIIFKGEVNCDYCDSLGIEPTIRFYFNSNEVMTSKVDGPFQLILPDTFVNFPELYMVINAEQNRRVLTNSIIVPFDYIDSIPNHNFKLSPLAREDTGEKQIVEDPYKLLSDSIHSFSDFYTYGNKFMNIILGPNHYTELRYGEFSYMGSYSIDAGGVVRFKFGNSVPKMFSEKNKRTCFKPNITGRLYKSKLIILSPCGDWTLKLHR